MNTATVVSTLQLKTVIASQEDAIEMGKWDAEHGLPMQKDAYVYANEWDAPYWQADYTYAYITAKGL